jgi:hypothetical protein
MPQDHRRQRAHRRRPVAQVCDVVARVAVAVAVEIEGSRTERAELIGALGERLELDRRLGAERVVHALAERDAQSASQLCVLSFWQILAGAGVRSIVTGRSRRAREERRVEELAARPGAAAVGVARAGDRRVVATARGARLAETIGARLTALAGLCAGGARAVAVRDPEDRVGCVDGAKEVGRVGHGVGGCRDDRLEDRRQLTALRRERPDEDLIGDGKGEGRAERNSENARHRYGHLRMATLQAMGIRMLPAASAV